MSLIVANKKLHFLPFIPNILAQHFDMKVVTLYWEPLKIFVLEGSSDPNLSIFQIFSNPADVDRCFIIASEMHFDKSGVICTAW